MMTKIFLVTFGKAIGIAVYGIIADWVEQRRLRKHPPHQ